MPCSSGSCASVFLSGLCMAWVSAVSGESSEKGSFSFVCQFRNLVRRLRDEDGCILAAPWSFPRKCCPFRHFAPGYHLSVSGKKVEAFVDFPFGGSLHCLDVVRTGAVFCRNCFLCCFMVGQSLSRKKAIKAGRVSAEWSKHAGME